MHGFISESTSKLSDGLWSAVKLTLLSILTSLIPQLFSTQFMETARTPLLIVLMAGGILFLFHSLKIDLQDTNRAMNGMLAGLLLWQSVRYSGLFEASQFVQAGGYLLWLGSGVLISLFWKRVLTTGMRFSLTIIMVHWLGRLLLITLSSWSYSGISPLLMFGSARLLGVAVFVVSFLFIVGFSSRPLQRRYAAIGIYSGIQLLFLLF